MSDSQGQLKKPVYFKESLDSTDQHLEKYLIPVTKGIVSYSIAFQCVCRIVCVTVVVSTLLIPFLLSFHLCSASCLSSTAHAGCCLFYFIPNCKSSGVRYLNWCNHKNQQSQKRLCRVERRNSGATLLHNTQEEPRYGYALSIGSLLSQTGAFNRGHSSKWHR